MESNIKRGNTVVYAIRFQDELDGAQTLRVLNQTGGNRSQTYDEIEISTKDIEGSDYGKKTETVGFEGLVTRGDVALQKINEMADNKQYVEILEIDTETKEAVVGSYKIDSIELEYPNDDSVTYTIEAKLFGSKKTETLVTVPAGATMETTPAV